MNLVNCQSLVTGGKRGRTKVNEIIRAPQAMNVDASSEDKFQSSGKYKSGAIYGRRGLLGSNPRKGFGLLQWTI